MFCAFVLSAQSPIRLVKIATGFNAPVHIASSGDNSGRLYVVEQAGRIRILQNGSVLAAPFLDITARVNCCGERGLLSVAFPPGFPSKRHFYVYYTALTGDITLSRFQLGASPDTADPASEEVLLIINHRQFGNHNGGQLAFGPDGFLYLGTGDGGGGGDTLGNGQNTGTLLAKLLRIEVEGGASPYGIPPGNPFAGVTGARPEIWAYGLRNPFRFSFDRTTHDLFIADVGQNLYEEVDFQPASSGGGQNYGWNIMEGLHCYQSGCNTAGLTLPVVEYDHSGGDCAIIGGFVYRGSRFPSIQGTYFYGDECGGRIWGLVRQNGNWSSSVLLETGMTLSTFGQDDAGELYVTDYSKGDIYLVAASAAAQVAAVVNAASFTPDIAPGALASVFGRGITTLPGVVAASAAPLPQAIGGISVSVGGVAAPILAVAHVSGAEQINFQVPFGVASGQTTVEVTNNGASTPPLSINLRPFAPAVFTTDGAHAAAQHGSGYAAISASDPAASNEVVLLYATGLGPVQNPPAPGSLAPVAPLSPTLNAPRVTIGGVDAPVEFAGLAPGTAGVYQLNVRVPPGLSQGEADVIVAVSGALSPPVKVSVK